MYAGDCINRGIVHRELNKLHCLVSHTVIPSLELACVLRRDGKLHAGHLSANTAAEDSRRTFMLRPEPVGNSMPLRAFIAAAALSAVE